MKKAIVFLLLLFSFNLYAEDLYIGEDEPVKQQEVKKPVKKKIVKKKTAGKKIKKSGLKGKTQKKISRPAKAKYEEVVEEEPAEVQYAPSAVKQQEEKSDVNNPWGNRPEEFGEKPEEIKKPADIQPAEKDFSVKKPDFNENRRRRVIGGHIFPTTVLFPTPVPSARFGFSQGYLTKKGEYLSLEDDGSIDRNSYNYAGLSEMFDSGIIVNSYTSLDLNAQITLSGGMEKKDFLTVEATPTGDVRIGPMFSYKFENDLLISFAPRYYISKGIRVSASYGIIGMINSLNNLPVWDDPDFQIFLGETAGEDGKINSIDEFFELVSSTYFSSNLSTVIKGFTKSIMINTSKTALSPSIGFAYPVTKYIGVQGILEYQKVKETAENKDKSINITEKYNKFNYGIACSLDYSHWMKFPLGTTFEYFREKNTTTKVNNYALSSYYQGIGDVQWGLIWKMTKYTYKDNEWKDAYSQKLIQFVITYFF